MDFMTQTLEEWSKRCGDFVNLLSGQVDGYGFKLTKFWIDNVLEGDGFRKHLFSEIFCA